MPDLWYDVDAALSEVPVNLLPLVSDSDFKTIDADVNYNVAGLALIWNFVTTAGAYTQTAVTPTDTGGNYDWVEQGNGMFTIEIPASGGASINNDTEGFGWFTGVATGILPWRGPVIGFRAAALNNSMIDGTTIDVNVTAMAAGVVTAAAIATGAIDADAIADNAIDAGAIAADAITAAKIADGAIDAGTFAAGAITASAIAADAIGASELAADAIAEIADAVWDEDATAHQTQGTFGQAIGDPGADTDTIWALANTNLDATVSSRASQTSVNTIDDFLDTEIAGIITTLGTPAGASISADIAAIEAQTDDIGAAGAGLTAIPWNAAWDTEVESEATDALNAYDPPTRAEATADKAEILAKIQGFILESGTIGATGNDTTHVHLATFTYGDDEINNYLLAIYDVSEDEYHARYIEDWANASKLATVATLPFTPQASTDGYFLLPFRQDVTGGAGLDAAGVRAAVGLAAANLDTQLGGIQSDTDAIQVTLGTPAGVSVSADILTIDNLVDDLESRIGTPSNLGGGATIAANLSDIEGQTDDIGVAGAGLTVLATAASIAALNNLSAAQVNAEVDTALADVNLDHLVGTATGIPAIPAGTYLDQMMDDGTAAFDRTTDSLQAIRDRGDAAWDTADVSALALQASVDDLEGRLTAARAGYLDNLSAGAVALETTAQAILTDTGTDGVVVAAGSKTGYALSAAGVQAIWDALTSALTTVGSIGKLLVDNINATIGSRSSHSAADVWSVATRVLTAGTNIALAKGVGVTGFNDLSAAQVNAEVVDALTVDVIADSVATDGSRPTMAQASLMILRFLTEKSVSGTTVTVKKEDGTTATMTFTLDSGTTPTSITRAS